MKILSEIIIIKDDLDLDPHLNAERDLTAETKEGEREIIALKAMTKLKTMKVVLIFSCCLLFIVIHVFRLYDLRC